jgi:hypothetical protein
MEFLALTDPGALGGVRRFTGQRLGRRVFSLLLIDEHQVRHGVKRADSFGEIAQLPLPPICAAPSGGIGASVRAEPAGKGKTLSLSGPRQAAA